MRLRNPIPFLFYFLFLVTPLVFTSLTSELFEFNKMMLVYFSATFVLAYWIFICIRYRKFVFRRSYLDLPILIFLLTQGISTLLSIDFRTSLLGYYGRFNGGFISSGAYAILYWGFINFMDKKSTKKSVLILLISGATVSIWGILEHIGLSLSCFILRGKLDVACWQEDVQNRVFATLGQPNWLAAFLVAIVPLSWNLATSIKLKAKSINQLVPYVLFTIFFITLLFTKSRSGLLGFTFAFIIYWGVLLLKLRKTIVNQFLFTTGLMLLAIFIIGTPFSRSLNELISPSAFSLKPSATEGPALETGGTESGEIRKIVWQGALDVWKNHPIFGTGPETFAYSYYKFRPIEHNITSEWDFIYNKAHNEYLNYLSTTGLVGFVSYVLLIIFSLKTIIDSITNFQIPISNQSSNFKLSKSKKPLENLALLAGYVSILVTNFFGFSVVTTSMLFFILPAAAVTLGDSKLKAEGLKLNKKLTGAQKASTLLALGFILYAVFCIAKYWYADTLYTKGKTLNEEGDYKSARDILVKAVNFSPSESLYWLALSDSTKNIAIHLANIGDMSEAKKSANDAFNELNTVTDLSPNNPNLKRIKYTSLSDLSMVDSKYLFLARKEVQDAIKLAPTDPKLYLSLGLVNYRIGQKQDAIIALITAIKLKPDYENAIRALEIMSK